MTTNIKFLTRPRAVQIPPQVAGAGSGGNLSGVDMMPPPPPSFEDKVKAALRQVVASELTGTEFPEAEFETFWIEAREELSEIDRALYYKNPDSWFLRKNHRAMDLVRKFLEGLK